MSNNLPATDGTAYNQDGHLEMENITSGIQKLGIHSNDLSFFNLPKFDIDLVPVVLESEHVERISKRTMIGFNNQLHPLYSIPKAIPPLSTDFSFTESEICSSELPLEQLLLAPLAVTPPKGCYYPLAPVGGYKLVSDSRYRRGRVYVAPYDVSKENVMGHGALLATTCTPPNVDPHLVGNQTFVSSPIPGMIQMVPGVPFAVAFNGDHNRLHTVACAQTLKSLQDYPDFEEILEMSGKLAKLTWGCKSHNNTPEMQPIYELPGLKENDRSTKRADFNTHLHDGSYNLANTVMKGEGQGTFLPAVQANTPTALAQISMVLQILQGLYWHIMPKCISKFEFEIINFHAEFNNVLTFGGLGSNGTSVQMNSSSLGETLSFYIGNVQGGWHQDISDDLCEWTLFTLLLRVGPDGDPGPFCLARSGLYLREKNVWIVFLVFKGSDLHSGFAPKEDPIAHQQWIEDNLSAAWNLAGQQNRVGYVNYVGSVPSQRTGSINISPPTLFGNYGSSQIHKAKQKNFAMHGHATLGGQDSYANKMGREILFNFWNSLQLCDLDLDLDIQELLSKISYQDHQSNSTIQLKPISFDPQHKSEFIKHYLQLYEWHRQEALLFYIHLPRTKLAAATKLSTAVPSEKANVIGLQRFQPSSKEGQGNITDSSGTLEIRQVLGQKIISGNVFYSVLLNGEENPIDISENSPQIHGNALLIQWLEKEMPSNLPPKKPTTVIGMSSSFILPNDSMSAVLQPIPRPTKPLPKPRKLRAIKQTPGPSLNKRKAPEESVGDNSDEEHASSDDEYEVEKIVNHRKENGDWIWEVKWKGYDETEWMTGDHLGGCIEALATYNSLQGIHPNDVLGSAIPTKPGQSQKQRKRPRVELSAGAVTLAANLSTLENLLSKSKLNFELQELELACGSSTSKNYHNQTSTRAMIELWGDQLYRNSFLNRMLVLLPAKSMKSSGLQFQLLQNSVEVLTPMAINMQKLSIIQSSFRFEMCYSLVKVFEWYTHLGPSIAQHLMHMHRAHGYSFLIKEAPQFAKLVDHVIQYVYQCIIAKFGSVNDLPQRNQKRRSKYANDQPLPSPSFGLNLDLSKISYVPADLYELTKTTSQTTVKLPKIVEFQIQHNTDALYSASAWCLQELWSKEVIIPKLRTMDKVQSGGKTSQFDDVHVYQRCLTRGAILWCISDACGTDGIFASSRMDDFLHSPAIIFEGALSRERKFAPEVLKKKDVVLEPLFNWIRAYIAENPDLPSKAKRLGELANSQMLELYIGKPQAVSASSKASVDPSLNGDIPEEAPILKAITFDELVSKNHLEGIQVTLLNLILREALNDKRKLKVGDEILKRVLIGDHATRSSTKKSNPDHTNPICQTLESVLLLKTQLPGYKLTSKVGISNILSWMGTGQGYKTRAFLQSITRPEGFFSSTLEEIVDIFQVVADRNAEIISKHPEHYKPQDLPGIIAVDDMLIWGQPNNLLSSAPTKNRIGEHTSNFTLLEKFLPYWTEELQVDWINLLGGMHGQDPEVYNGPRRAWHDILAFLKKHKIIGFGSGLTSFQLANRLVALKIVDSPTVTEMADWIFKHRKLGAYRGLVNLGFCLTSENLMSVHCAFKCIYSHFDENLTKEDKDILFFGPIFVEHILCKIPRWQSRLADENAEGHLEKLALEVERSHDWISGTNMTDHKAFPVPSLISSAWLKNIIEQENSLLATTV